MPAIEGVRSEDFSDRQKLRNQVLTTNQFYGMILRFWAIARPSTGRAVKKLDMIKLDLTNTKEKE